MAESSEENEESVLFNDKTEENETQNISETHLASKQHGSISEIDKVSAGYAPDNFNNTVDKRPPYQNTETEIKLDSVRRSARQKTQNYTDRESVENEEMYRQRRSLGGHQGRVTTVVTQLFDCITKGREPNEITNILESLEKAWYGYDNAYRKYISRQLSEEEFARLEEAYLNVSRNHALCTAELKRICVIVKKQCLNKRKWRNQRT